MFLLPAWFFFKLYNNNLEHSLNSIRYLTRASPSLIDFFSATITVQMSFYRKMHLSRVSNPLLPMPRIRRREISIVIHERTKPAGGTFVPGDRKGSLGCLHPVGHFRHALRHVASVAPCTLAATLFYSTWWWGRIFFFKGRPKLMAVQPKGLSLNIR